MLVLAATLLLTAAAASPPAAPSSGVGTPATVLDLGVAQGDGRAVPLRTVVGERPTIVAFWASYCVACRAEVPALNRAADRWSARGLRIVGVSLESNAERVSAARTAWGIRYDVFRLASENDALIERLFPRGLPVAAFVRDGRTTLHEQLLDDAELARLVPSLLGHGRPAK